MTMDCVTICCMLVKPYWGQRQNQQHVLTDIKQTNAYCSSLKLIFLASLTHLPVSTLRIQRWPQRWCTYTIELNTTNTGHFTFNWDGITGQYIWVQNFRPRISWWIRLNRHQKQIRGTYTKILSHWYICIGDLGPEKNSSLHFPTRYIGHIFCNKHANNKCAAVTQTKDRPFRDALFVHILPM